MKLERKWLTYKLSSIYKILNELKKLPRLMCADVDYACHDS